MSHYLRRRIRGAIATGSLGALAALPVALGAQASAQQPMAAQRPPAAAADVASPDALIAALYDVISGPAGQKRNWDRFRSLFVPGAKLMPTGVRPDSTVSFRILDVDDYALQVGPRLEDSGFFEREITRQWERFGNVAHAFSTYESRRKADDPKPFARGINSIQLLNDGKRWWVVSVYWDSERPTNQIPTKYLPK
jgi:hypothetical protein